MTAHSQIAGGKVQVSYAFAKQRKAQKTPEQQQQQQQKPNQTVNSPQNTKQQGQKTGTESHRCFDVI